MTRTVNTLLVLVIFVLLYNKTITAQNSSQSLDSIKVVASGATLMLVSKQFSFTEGPAPDNKGNIYFTDQPNDKIWKYAVDGKLTLFMDKTGRSNGLYFDHKGNIVSCADEKGELLSINTKRKKTVLLAGFHGHRLNGPNDLWSDNKGGIYFTDPYYQRDYWERKKPDIDGQNVYYLPKGKHEAFIVDSLLLQPNGIVGTPDGLHLFVADIRDNKTYKYQVNEDGSLSNRQLFISQGSDGMTLDNGGNLYLTGRGVTVYDKTGNLVGNIPVPSGWVGNVCFGGKNFSMLFITASAAVYTLQMQVIAARPERRASYSATKKD